MKISVPKTDRILGVSAMVVSVLTLIIFIYQTNIINQQSRLSVKPKLLFEIARNITDTTLTFEQTLKNKGLGPAIIKKASILYEEKKFPIDFEGFTVKKFPKIANDLNLIESSSVIEGLSILPDETVTIFKVEIQKSELQDMVEYLELNPMSMSAKWKFQIEYTSMYENDKVWKLNAPCKFW